jgi:predicted ATPase/DNA-binding winged helix-turn-helix (wHTH) protein
MSTPGPTLTTDEILFGPFRLLPAQHLLFKGDQPVAIGSRALDVLIALLENPGELVSKEKLMTLVWPNVFVGPANLTVHISALRRILGDQPNGNRFLINIHGRGYRFIAPTTARPTSEFPATKSNLVETRTGNLPAITSHLLGRDGAIAESSVQLSRNRLLTIVGPGGVGKTALSLALAERQVADYEDGIWCVDLGFVDSSHAVRGALAAAIGSDVSELQDRKMLILLDNCEHMVGTAAGLAQEILTGARDIKILATSREPFRTDGEKIYWLNPLEFPQRRHDITAQEALSFPAVQMFVERVTVDGFVLNDTDVPFVVEICQSLDGLPLALEAAASRVAAFGLRRLAKSVKGSLEILTNGHRTALPRQQSLQSTLDWSYRLLSEPEQVVFRRLAIFADTFTLSDVIAVVSDDNFSEAETSDLAASLVSKSLVLAHFNSTEPRFRLLETTRTYAYAKLAESKELESISRRDMKWRLEKQRVPSLHQRCVKSSKVSNSKVLRAAG